MANLIKPLRFFPCILIICALPGPATHADPPTWPTQPGLTASFCPSGANYGDIGDLTITNHTDQTTTVTVPEGLLLDSQDPLIQDLYVADVATTPLCAGAEELDTPISIAPEDSVTITDVPGFCPDYELLPPEAGNTDTYVCCVPDEKGEELVSVVESCNNYDVEELDLQVFGEDQALTMITQGACWMTDSLLDDANDNTVTEEDVEEHFLGTFAVAAEEALSTMTRGERTRVESQVHSDIVSIVAATSFVSKQHVDDDLVQGDDDEVTEDDGSTIEIADDPPPPCVYCRLIVIYGNSQHFDSTNERYVLTDPPIQKAHDAAAHFAADDEDCLIVVHPKWRSGKRNQPDAYLLKETVRDANTVVSWVGNSRLPIGKPITHTPDGEEIDCYSQVLLIYHGTHARTSVNALKWLQRNAKAPIRRLVLWSCWGSKKITPKMLKPFMRTMARRDAKKPQCDCDLEIFTGADVVPTKEMVAQIKSKKKREKILKELSGFATPLGIHEDETNMTLTSPEHSFRRYTYDGRNVNVQENVESTELFDGVPIAIDESLSATGFAREYIGAN